jgi:hypothetical protein
MPDIKIIKLKIRRGTDAQRKSIILEQGELGYTTDYQRLFVGNGTLQGGNVVGNIVHPPLISVGGRAGLVNAVPGDLVYESTTLYQLTGTDMTALSSWVNITPNSTLTVDNLTTGLNGSNQIEIKNNGITGSKFASTAVYNQGGLIANATNGLSANVDSKYVVLSSNKITISPISADKISSAALGNGLLGGNGTPLYLNVGSGFSVATGTLELTDIPNALIYGTLSASTTSDVLSVFNGKPNQITAGLPLTTQTLITVVSASPGETSTVNITLTSAGFITLESASTEVGGAVNRFAIPIFNY